MKRKIAAILAADVAEYSRLVAEDEEETLRHLIASMEVFKVRIEEHGGRVFNTAGDAILAEFSSAVEAVRASIDIQHALSVRNEVYVPNRRMLFRMGISIGDVVENDGDLLGDGVNIAARLQTLSEPGGLAISRWVQEQVAGKVPADFRDAGYQLVKNMPAPIHVFRSSIGRQSTEPEPSRTIASRISARGWRIGSVAAGSTAFAAAVAFAVVRYEPSLVGRQDPLAVPQILPSPANDSRHASPDQDPAWRPESTSIASPEAARPSRKASASSPSLAVPAALSEPAPTTPASAAVLEPAPPASAVLSKLPQSTPSSPAPFSSNSPASNVLLENPFLPVSPGLENLPAPGPGGRAALPSIADNQPVETILPPFPSIIARTQPNAFQRSSPAASLEQNRSLDASTLQPSLDRKQQKVRCAEVLQRAQLGELTGDDRDFLRQKCR